MLYPLRKIKHERASMGRIVLALALTSVLLASALPLNALASRGCKMACCVGKLSHGAESCSVSFAGGSRQGESPDTLSEEGSAHGHAEKGEAHATSGGESQTASIGSQATTSCSPECACAACAYTQRPRPRETAAASNVILLRPPALIIFNESFSKLLLPWVYLRWQNSPRAPPISPVNTSA